MLINADVDHDVMLEMLINANVDHDVMFVGVVVFSLLSAAKLISVRYKEKFPILI